jgi:hypothetical protein
MQELLQEKLTPTEIEGIFLLPYGIRRSYPALPKCFERAYTVVNLSSEIV